MAPLHLTGNSVSRRLLLRSTIAVLACLGTALSASAQQPVALPNAPPGVVLQAYTLTDCVRIGLERQPTLTAARASLASAETQRNALDKMVLASLVSRELHFRRQQACLGVTIAQAGLQQNEHEAIYAITRNYFSVVYARQQETLTRALVERLKSSRGIAEKAVKKGDPDAIVTQVDVDRLSVNIDLYQLRVVEAEQGALRALAALREAMGLTQDCPLLVAEGPLPALGQPLDRQELISLALSRRGELVQAGTASQIFDIEIQAQGTSLKPTMRTFASGSDIHARQIPQGISNHQYRPGAIDVEMPVQLAGKRHDRMERARDLSVRAGAVVDKTRNLIVLETEDAFLKWQDAYRRVVILQQSMPKALAVAASVRARFENSNKVSSEEVLRAETLQDQVQAQLNEALYQHALAVAALERITSGGLMPTYRQP